MAGQLHAEGGRSPSTELSQRVILAFDLRRGLISETAGDSMQRGLRKGNGHRKGKVAECYLMRRSLELLGESNFERIMSQKGY